MSKDAKAFYEKWPSDFEAMKSHAAATVQGFGTLFAKVMADGAIPVKTKEFVALGIAVAQRCTPCINLHVQKCIGAGATREEVLEAAAVAVMMSGGPGYTHLAVVLDALAALGK